MTNFNWYLISLFLICFHAKAYVENNVMLKGKLIQYDAKVATLEINRNKIKIPTRAVKAMDYKPGQNVVVFVDFHDLVDLNMKQLVEKGIVEAAPRADATDKKNRE